MAEDIGSLRETRYADNMKAQTIEVDESTAATLEARAAERGLTISELVAELVTALESSEVAELDRRWKAVEAGGATVANADVVRWLETWGTPDFRPWREK
jgi:predicted transcriptional regulator